MISFEEKDRCLRIRLNTERLEALNVEAFKSDIAQIPLLRPCELELDLASLVFVDSSGIGAMLSLLTRTDPPLEHIRILHAQPQVANVIRMLRLDKVLDLEG